MLGDLLQDLTTAWHYACKNVRDDVALLEWLQSLGIPDSSSVSHPDLVTPFMVACQNGNLAVAKWLKAHTGVDVNTMTNLEVSSWV